MAISAEETAAAADVRERKGKRETRRRRGGGAGGRLADSLQRKGRELISLLVSHDGMRGRGEASR